MNLLLINAHQKYPNAKGELNSYIQKKIEESFKENGYSITETKIEDGYNPEEEVEKHVNADVVIIQSPVYWFSVPWLSKKYIDLVFSTGLGNKKMCNGDGRTSSDPSKQYGTGGNLMGKKFMLSLTWNSPRDAFGDKNQYLAGGKSVDDVFFHICASYKFCGFDIANSCSIFDVFKNPKIEDDIALLKDHLHKNFFAKS